MLIILAQSWNAPYYGGRVAFHPLGGEPLMKPGFALAHPGKVQEKGNHTPWGPALFAAWNRRAVLAAVSLGDG
jgi:hypothetical protein